MAWVDAMTCRLEFPWPPSMNSQWRNIDGRTVLSASARKWKASATQAMWCQRLHVFGDERVKVSVDLHAPTRARYDIDNRVKLLLDSLQRLNVVVDDSQVDVLVINRGEIRKGGLAVVTVESLGKA